MRKQQNGLSILGLIFVLFIIVVLALFAMKIIPSFLEFRTAKTAIELVARNAQNPQEARRAFESRAAIDNIDSIRPQDLEISRDGNQLVIAFAYRKEVPLFGGVGLYIDYAANSRGN
jgi:type II secretory pathway pseudopilin PulG